MLVKICGLSNIMDAMSAVKSGADALGFVMGGNVLPPEVEPHAQVVREIIKQVPSSVDSYIVTHLLDPQDIIALSDYVQSSGIQISEDIGLENIKLVREQTKKKIIKTVVVKDKSSLQYLKEVEPFVDYLLLDSRVGGYTGGTGVTSDWNICLQLIKLARKPVFLAGGLNPDNVLAAIKKTHPQGVDVSTGVSTYSEMYLRKDRKDPAKIEAFIKLSKGL